MRLSRITALLAAGTACGAASTRVKTSGSPTAPGSGSASGRRTAVAFGLGAGDAITQHLGARLEDGCMRLASMDARRHARLVTPGLHDRCRARAAGDAGARHGRA